MWKIKENLNIMMIKYFVLIYINNKINNKKKLIYTKWIDLIKKSIIKIVMSLKIQNKIKYHKLIIWKKIK